MNSENRKLSAEIAFAASHYKQERDYWLSKLSGNLIKSNFPGKHKRKIPDVDDHVAKTQVSTLGFSLRGELFDRLLKLSGGSDPKLHMILVAVLAALLDKYTGNQDILLGTPIYTPAVEGEFINTVLPLRIRITSTTTFKELLIRTRQIIIEASQKVNYPIEKLLYQLNLPVSATRFPLFDISLLLENIQDKKYIRHIPLSMLLSFKRTGNAVEGVIEYDTSVYRRSLVEQVADHFQRLLGNVLCLANVPLPAITILSASEKKHILFNINNTEAAYPGNTQIQQLVEVQAEKKPGYTTLNFEHRHLSYGELNKRTDRLAGVLRAKGITADSIAAVMADFSLEVIIGLLGILKAGGAYLAVDLKYPKERVGYILKDSNTRVILTQHSCQVHAQFPAQYIYLDDSDLYKPGAKNPGNAKQSHNLVYVLYTSGSTGKPRGVMVEHRGVVNYISWAEKVYLRGESNRFCLYSSLSFDLTVTSIYLPLITGNQIVIYKEDENEDIISRIIREDRVQIIKLTPTHLKIIKSIEIFKSGIKKLVVGGEELPAALAREVYDKFKGNIEIYNEYGPTETVVGCMIYQFTARNRENDGESVPIGVPLDNTQVYLLDPYRNPSPPSTIGEIYISGHGVARGYLNNPGMTREKFGTNPFDRDKPIYRSGDLGRWLPDGNMEYLGRIDSQIKIRGYRVELGEIENRLIGYKGIEDAVVAAKDDVTGDKYLVAYVVANHTHLKQNQPELDIPGLKEYLLQELPGYMIPTYFVPVEKIPLTPNGKVDRKALPEPSPNIKESYTAPQNNLQKKLLELWSEVLGIEKDRIGIDMNFFDLGGHSLKATILTAKIHKEFNITFTLSEMFLNPTVRRLSTYITVAEKENHLVLEPAEKKEYYTLSAAQKRMYVVHQLEQQSVAYNMPLVLKLLGKPDRQRLEEAFRKLIHRHQVLRTSFIMIKNEQEPAQKIHEIVEFEIQRLTALTVAPHHEIRETAIPQVIRNFLQPFDLSQAPLLRVGMIKTGQEDHVLMVDMPHIISDGVSLGILLQDFTALYKGEALSRLKLQYQDFSEWQTRLFQQGIMKKREDYWLNRFGGDIPLLNIPADYPRPAVRSVDAGDQVRVILEEDLTGKLYHVVEETSTTLFIFLLAVYNLLLFKYTGQEDLVVGSPVTGRNHVDLQHIVGVFLNMLPMRNQLRRDEVFREVLAQVKENALKALENQDYPFDKLVGKLKLQGKTDRNPLFDTEFALNNIEGYDAPNNEIPGLRLEEYHWRTQFAKFDLHLLAFEINGTLHLVLRYYTALFKKSTAEKIIKHYVEIIKQVVENLDMKLKDIEVSLNFLNVESKVLKAEEGDFDLSFAPGN